LVLKFIFDLESDYGKTNNHT